MVAPFVIPKNKTVFWVFSTHLVVPRILLIKKITVMNDFSQVNVKFDSKIKSAALRCVDFFPKIPQYLIKSSDCDFILQLGHLNRVQNVHDGREVVSSCLLYEKRLVADVRYSRYGYVSIFYVFDSPSIVNSFLIANCVSIVHFQWYYTMLGSFLIT